MSSPHISGRQIQTHFVVLAGSPGVAVLRGSGVGPREGLYTLPLFPAWCSVAPLPQTQWILVYFYPRWTKVINKDPIHTHAVHPSYNCARLSKFVASLMT